MALMDIVDENDNIIGNAEFEDVYKSHKTSSPLLFRTVAVMVFNSEGKLVLQKRSKRLPIAPGLWETSASGHIDLGDSYEQAALKELEEELGINVDQEDLIFVRKLSPDKENIFCFNKLFVCINNGPYIPNDEVEEIVLVSIDDLMTDIVKKPEKYTKSLESNIRYYKEKHNGWSNEAKNTENMSSM